MRNGDGFGFGVMTGAVMVLVIWWALGDDLSDRQEMKRQFQAHEACIADNQCHMSVEDFGVYYDLKHKLLQED